HTHTHTNTQTHTHTPTHTRWSCFSLSFSVSLTHTHTCTLSPIHTHTCYIGLGFCLLPALVCAFLAVGGDWAGSCNYWDRPTRIKATQFPRWTLALASQRQTLAHNHYYNRYTVLLSDKYSWYGFL